ncbi:hypothetical protein AAHA92_15860 [Salvia divinorum]|uniref:Uncharacterized protein n=1 Tax=Salvia divinorum TaxID=28513 RepID=A0ABD1GTP1_SALDI
MAEDGQDLFVRILKCSKLTESQEAKLLNCPFARDSENVMDSIPLTQFSSMTQSEADHLVIGQSSILEEDSVFHTPPEHHSRSHLSSDDDQNPNVDDRKRQVRASEERLDDEQESKRVRAVPGRTRKVRALEAGMDNEPESKRIRAVAGDSKTVPLAVVIEEDDGVHSTEVIDLSDSEGEERAEGDGVELGEIGVPRGENCDSSRILKGKAVEECAGMPKDNRHGDDGGERIEGLRDGEGGRRRLPPSMEDNDIVEEVGLFGMVDKLRAIFGFPGAGEHVDFLETAKKNGMAFPKPRWQQES